MPSPDVRSSLGINRIHTMEDVHQLLSCSVILSNFIQR